MKLSLANLLSLALLLLVLGGAWVTTREQIARLEVRVEETEKFQSVMATSMMEELRSSRTRGK